MNKICMAHFHSNRYIATTRKRLYLTQNLGFRVALLLQGTLPRPGLGKGKASRVIRRGKAAGNI